jgi:hypothetical protein
MLVFAVAVCGAAFGNRDRALKGIDNVGGADVLGRAREFVTAVGATGRRDQSGMAK